MTKYHGKEARLYVGKEIILGRGLRRDGRRARSALSTSSRWKGDNPRKGIETRGEQEQHGQRREQRWKGDNPRKGIETGEMAIRQFPASERWKGDNPRKGIETWVWFGLRVPQIEWSWKGDNPRKGIETERQMLEEHLRETGLERR